MSLRTDLQTSLSAIIAAATAYLDAHHAIPALVSHSWLVVIDEPGCGMAVVTDGDHFRLRNVPGDLIGVSQWNRDDAVAIAKHWNANAPGTPVRVARNVDVVTARKADAASMLQILADWTQIDTSV